MAPNQYTIGVTKNKFALLDGEEEVDPHELLKKQEKEKEERKKAKALEKTTKPAKGKKSNGQGTKPSGNSKSPPNTKLGSTAPKEAARPRSIPVPKKIVNLNEKNQYRPKRKSSSQEESSSLERDRENKVHPDNRANVSSGSESGMPDRVRDKRNNGFSRVFVRGGGRGKPGFDNGRKREYDRRSGSDKTGVKPVDKRRSSGSFNWGNAEDEILNAQVPQQEPKSPEGSQTAEKSKNIEKNETVKAEEGQAVPTEGEEKPVLTLDEWKAIRNNRSKPNYNIRKPGEGEDLTRWKDMIVLTKKDTDEEEDEELEYGEFPQRVGRQKRLEIDVRFNDRQRRGVRGSRGMPRGPLGQQPAVPAPKVDDEADFPSLVKAKK